MILDGASPRVKLVTNGMPGLNFYFENISLKIFFNVDDDKDASPTYYCLTSNMFFLSKTQKCQ